MIVDFKSTIVFRQLCESLKRISVHEGGTRSGKTVNILIWKIVDALTNKNTAITSITRKTLPALKASAYRDFLNILNDYNLYTRTSHNKSELTYQINNTLFEFFGLDEEQKIRGRKRNKLFINEANEISYYEWTQLILRTSGKIILDYNPSESDHFIYDKIIPRDDCDLTRTTFLDNPFIEDSIKQEILRLKGTDANLWRVYGLGLRGTNEAQIFTNWEEINELPETRKKLYGLDFGFNHPTALIEVRIDDDRKELYLKEVIYERGLITKDIIEKLIENGISKKDYIYADNARPEQIEEIYRASFNIHASEKGKNSVKMGIDLLKTYKIYIEKSSINLIKERKAYKWKQDKNGNVLDEPVDAFNHGIDGIRYAVYTDSKKLSTGITKDRSSSIPNTLTSGVNF